MKNPNFAFFGTPDIASKTLEILFSNGYVPKVIITSPDARSGRNMNTYPTPVSIWATKNNIPCIKLEDINLSFIEDVKKLNLDLSIVVAYGKILPEELINTPKLGTINIHYSLLPQYRGASPIEQSLLNGDTTTGVTIQQMVYKLDAGPILAQQKIEINTDDTKESLKEKLVNIGGQLLCNIIPTILSKNIEPKNQDENIANYCKKIKKQDGQILLEYNSNKNYNKYRAFFGWPGTYFFIRKNNKDVRIKIIKAKYENNSFIIERVVPEGKKEINYSEFISNISK